MNQERVPGAAITIKVYRTILFYFVYLHCFLALLTVFKVTANLFNEIISIIFNRPIFDVPDAILAEWLILFTYGFFYLAFYSLKSHREEWLVIFIAGLLGFGIVPMAAIHQNYCNFDDGFMGYWTGPSCNVIFCIHSWIMLIIQLVILYFGKTLWDLYMPP